uniref:Uncharacterized protein n=1 Tax=uncultured Thiotrichaceae bacterium TaxID=298394 RepID=A0A6S6UMV1_9GAMM|nr:MAG: Unknown protein [uncultured Thiotrichaceae bacterium]
MKRFAVWVGGILMLLLAGFFLFGGGATEQKQPDNLPWDTKLTPEGHTEVFHLSIGQVTLREMIEHFHHFPEIALFTSENKAPRLEAYFGKRRLGIFEARLIAEMDADESQMQQFVDTSIDREAQASGAWKYTLSEDSVKQINEQKVRYLVYMPIADYKADIVVKRFGEPVDKFVINETGEIWFYPNKGLAILLDNDGKDVVHYSSSGLFDALRERLIAESTIEAEK